MHGIDRKADGGYVILYQIPVDFSLGLPIKNKEDFEALLPVTYEIPKKEKSIETKKPQYVNGVDRDEEGIRNTRLFQRLKDGTLDGNRPGYDEGIAIARNSKLPEDEIQRTIQSVIKQYGPPPKPDSEPDVDHNFKDTDNIRDKKEKIKETVEQLKKAMPELSTETDFAIKDFCVNGEITYIYSDGGIGKSTLSIYIAYCNFHKIPLWEGLDPGDGRKSLYICLERKPQDAFDKLYASGGNAKEIDIFTHFGDERLNLLNNIHRQAIYNKIKTGDYAYVIFDSVSVLIEDVNKRKDVEKAFNELIDQLSHLKTAYIMLSHIKKDGRGLISGGALLGSVMQKNMATSVLRIMPKLDGEGVILFKEKANKSKLRGGLEFNVVLKPVPKEFSQDKTKTHCHATVDGIVYRDEMPETLKKLCPKDIPSEVKIKEVDIFGQIIDSFKNKNDGRLPDTTYLKNEAIRRGISANHYNGNWKDYIDYLGYTTKSNGLKGGHHKLVLVEKLFKP